MFEKFRELGSARQVLLWYRQKDLPLPTLSADSCRREVAWEQPGYSRVLSILKNPVYAGAFVYGRRQTRTVIVEGRARKTAGHEVPLDDWTILLKDHHAGYISWGEYVGNQQQLESNLSKYHAQKTRGKGAPNTGPALLAGLLRCARCGRKFHVCYSGVGGRVPRYGCRGANVNHGVEKCISFGGLRADETVAEHVLEALQPIGVQAAIDAWERMRQEEDQERRAVHLALEARYEADRARRQYDASEPENRLLTVELERRWEQSLQRVSELEQRLKETDRALEPTSHEERASLMALGDDLRQLWFHPSASAAIKKRILRTVLEEVIADVSDDPPEIRLILHWGRWCP